MVVGLGVGDVSCYCHYVLTLGFGGERSASGSSSAGCWLFTFFCFCPLFTFVPSSKTRCCWQQEEATRIHWCSNETRAESHTTFSVQPQCEQYLLGRGKLRKILSRFFPFCQSCSDPGASHRRVFSQARLFSILNFCFVPH